MSVMDNNNSQSNVNDYVPLNTRLQELKTRLEVPEYNETQQVLFTNDCVNLTKDVYKKVCRFITDCDVPSTELCLVDISYKESVPPSHPREELPINLLSNLLTCCEPGRIACPELLMYSEEASSDFSEMMLHDYVDLPTGRLNLGINFKNRVHCCESEEDSLEDFDFIEVIPSMKFSYECLFGSFEYSGEFYDSIEICYKRLEFLRKYHIWLDLCASELSFEADLVPVGEHCLACDTTYSTEAESSVENACGNLKVKIKKDVDVDWCSPDLEERISIELEQECKGPQTYVSTGASASVGVYGSAISYSLGASATVDWCKGNLELYPSLSASSGCKDVLSMPSAFQGAFSFPGCSPKNSMNFVYNGSSAPTLHCDGTIDSGINLNIALDPTKPNKLGPDSKFSFVYDVDYANGKLYVYYKTIVFSGGIFCGVVDGDIQTFDIDCGGGDIINKIDCYELRRRCRLCTCDPSDSSSSSSSRSDSTSTSKSESKDPGITSCWTISVDPMHYSYTSASCDFKDRNGNVVGTTTKFRYGDEDAEGYRPWYGIAYSNVELAYEQSVVFYNDTSAYTTTGLATKGCNDWSDSSSSSSPSNSPSSSSSSSSSSN